MTVPAWIQDAVLYQIFPDRFANGDPSNDPVNVQPWGAPPTVRGFQGGDLRGISQHMAYLADLGINALYLNPIFMAASTHRYDTTDYFRIEPKLGSLADFHELIETAHRHKIRVVLDGVFNHCGRGFFAFSDVMENQEDSPYRNWFHILRFPLRAYEGGHARNYKAWWGIKSLPKFNTDTPAVRRYILDVARYWIEQGADGWRLDVPNEIDDDGFWAEFRAVVKQANPEAYILGEIWDLNPRWADDDHFDGLMNYPVRTAVLGWLNGTISTALFQESFERITTAYAPENLHAMFVPLGSHDTERALTHFSDDTRKMGLAFLLQFGYPGAPSVYYGDEIGMRGGKDPDCRRAFPWEEAAWDRGLRDWVKLLIAARAQSPALRRGSYLPIAAQDAPACCAFARVHAEETVIVAANASAEAVDFRFSTAMLTLPDGTQLQNMLDSRSVTVEKGSISLRLEPFTGVYLH